MTTFQQSVAAAAKRNGSSVTDTFYSVTNERTNGYANERVDAGGRNERAPTTLPIRTPHLLKIRAACARVTIDRTNNRTRSDLNKHSCGSSSRRHRSRWTMGSGTCCGDSDRRSSSRVDRWNGDRWFRRRRRGAVGRRGGRRGTVCLRAGDASRKTVKEERRRVRRRRVVTKTTMTMVGVFGFTCARTGRGVDTACRCAPS